MKNLEAAVRKLRAQDADPGLKDHSTHPTVVQYAVQEMLKGKSPQTAAKVTTKKLSGNVNMFISPDAPVHIEPKLLERALWEYLVDHTIEQISKIKPGMEHYALDTCINKFRQSPKIRPRLKTMVIEKLGKDPFTNDDESVD